MFQIFRKSKSNGESKYYFGLILREIDGVGLLLEVNSLKKTISIIDERRFNYTDGWEHIVEDVDEVLFKLERENKIEIQQVIYFLYSHIVDQDKQEIKKPYIGKIKRISSELGIKPVGYIEYHEAISYYLTHHEENPLTALIIEADKPTLSLFVYKGGELVFNKACAKTGDIVADLKSLFVEPENKIVLPSRIIIYDSGDLSKEAQALSSYKWDENIFIHIPKVEIIAEQDLQKALILSFSSQIFNRVDSKAIDTESEVEDSPFVIGEDVRPEDKNISQTSAQKSDPEIFKDEYIQEDVYESSISAESARENFLKKLRSLVKIPANLIKNMNLKGNYLLLSIIALILLITATGFIILNFHKAKVILYFDAQKEERELNIDASVGDESSPEALLLRPIEQNLSKTERITTSGKKTIGDKAKGEINIYNLDRAEKTFKKGTIFATSGNIKFLLDNDVKVASASESLNSDGNLLTITGKAKSTATAGEIGEAANISDKQKLKIENFPLTTYFAIPTSSFSGGNKKDIQTVSKEDALKLKNKIIDEMKKMKEETASQKKDNEKIIDKISKVELTKEEYSKEIGEEGKELVLKAKGKATYFAYNDSDLKKIIQKLLTQEIPENYELTVNNIKYHITDALLEKDKTKLTISVEGKAIFKIDENQFKKDIKGKTKFQAKELVKNKYKAHEVDFDIWPPLLIIGDRLPVFIKNISIESKII